MVYSFFQPGLDKDSLGTFIILDHIAIARDLGLPYVYLGYWVPGSPKMAYKANFAGVEVYAKGEWSPIGAPTDYDAALNPLTSDPIADQVAMINLPDGRS